VTRNLTSNEIENETTERELSGR